MCARLYQLDFFNYNSQESNSKCFYKRESVDSYLREWLATYREDEGLKQLHLTPPFSIVTAFSVPMW